MFTGIVQKKCSVAAVERLPRLLKYAIALDETERLALGASIAIDGVCQTVVKIENGLVWFDVIEETLKKTTLNDLVVGRIVNVERAVQVGDELGGHQMSGHVYGTAQIAEVVDNRYVIQLPEKWSKYFFELFLAHSTLLQI